MQALCTPLVFVNTRHLVRPYGTPLSPLQFGVFTVCAGLIDFNRCTCPGRAFQLASQTGADAQGAARPQAELDANEHRQDKRFFFVSAVIIGDIAHLLDRLSEPNNSVPSEEGADPKRYGFGQPSTISFQRQLFSTDNLLVVEKLSFEVRSGGRALNPVITPFKRADARFVLLLLSYSV